MKTYKATFSAASAITQLPTAQTLFGAFCQSIKDIYGQEKLNEYLASFQKNPLFIHSNLFPEGLFPAPAETIFSLELVYQAVHHCSPEEKLSQLSRFKEYKKVRYFSMDVFERYVLNKGLGALRKELVQSQNPLLLKKEEGILTTKRENSSIQMTSAILTRSGTIQNKQEKDLFYIPQIYPSANQRFSLYIQCEEEYLPTIRKVLELLSYTGIGYKRSVGLNAFQFESLEEIHLQSKCQKKMLLSDCIPDGDIDFSQSSYQMKSAIYRGSKSYNGGECTGRFSALSAGSMIVPLTDKHWYGRLVSTVSDGKVVYHYGIGLVL